MRTTIDLPAYLKQKLITYAALHNLKGYSSIIVEALKQYFEKHEETRETIIRSLKGCINELEYEAEMKRIEEGRKNWKI